MSRTDDDRLTVLYDADCGFCTHSARVLLRLDGGRALRLLPLQRAAAVIPDAPSVETLMALMHVVDRDGRWSIGGAAWMRILDRIAITRPLAMVGRLPGMGRVIEPAYRLIADHRHTVSRVLGMDACHVPRSSGDRPARAAGG